MEVKLEKRYPLDVSPARAWLVLRDVRAVAGCMPGAQITEELSPTQYKGAVKVKVGPAVAAFGGEIEVRALEESERRMRLFGKGADKGGSSASMDLNAWVEPVPGEAGKSVLVGEVAVIVNGKFAQFGGRLMGQVSDMVLGQFAEQFRIAAAATPDDALPMVAEVPLPVADPVATSVASPVATARTESPPRVVVPSPTPPPAPAMKELNAGSLIWGLIKGWFAGLFGKRA